jgi:hypothetical protein
MQAVPLRSTDRPVAQEAHLGSEAEPPRGVNPAAAHAAVAELRRLARDAATRGRIKPGRRDAEDLLPRSD